MVSNVLPRKWEWHLATQRRTDRFPKCLVLNVAFSQRFSTEKIETGVHNRRFPVSIQADVKAYRPYLIVSIYHVTKALRIYVYTYCALEQKSRHIKGGTVTYKAQAISKRPSIKQTINLRTRTFVSHTAIIVLSPLFNVPCSVVCVQLYE